MTSNRFSARSAACAAALLLGACTVSPPASRVSAPLAEAWYAPLPHAGSLNDLRDWWARLDDPALLVLIDAAEQASASVAAAASRIAQARVTEVTAGAALGPSVDSSVAAQRGNATFGIPLNTTLRAGLQASWEVDMFGRNQLALTAARERSAGARSLWHDARVSVAAEVATQLLSRRTCLRRLALAEDDQRSRAETARLTAINVRAGFAPGSAEQRSQASVADGQAGVLQLRTQCELPVKALVALTALPEPAVRTELARSREWPRAPLTPIPAVPAQLLSQRPDVFNAERELAAAAADVGNAQAQRLPRLSLTGSVGRARFSAGGQTVMLDTWSLGPFTLSLPLVDGGRLKVNIEAAQAAYDEAVAQYRGKVLNAVREVEEALLNLDSAAGRAEATRLSASRQASAFEAEQRRYQSGLASLLELEDSRRALLQARQSMIEREQEQAGQWIALYRALGGGFTPEPAAPTASISNPSIATRKP